MYYRETPDYHLNQFWQRQRRLQVLLFRFLFILFFVSVFVGIFILEYNFLSLREEAREKTSSEHWNEFPTLVERRNHPLEDEYEYMSRICFILQPSQVDMKRHTSRVKSIKKTWAKHVPRNRLFFVGNHSYDPLEKVLQPDYHVLDYGGGVLLNALIESLDRCPEDTLWFVKGDTNTFFVVRSLFRYLESMEQISIAKTSMLMPMFLGRPLTDPHGTIFNSGGAGYILSRPALLLAADAQKDTRKDCSVDLMKQFRKKQKSKAALTGDDLIVARCLSSLGVVPMETRDQTGADRFHAFDPGAMVLNRAHSWYHDYSKYKIQPGLSCCSAGSISFHYVEEGAAKYIDTFLDNQTSFLELSNKELLEYVPTKGFGGFGTRPSAGNCEEIFKFLLRKMKPGILPPNIDSFSLK